MRSVRLRLALWALLVIPSPLVADTVVVVSASRLESEVSKLGSSVTVITAEDIQRSQASQVQDVLRTVPGLDVVRSGPMGGNTSVFLRGANAEHTLVLIDGVEANNPVTTARLFNFADVPVDAIERIEIVRGPQSTLYGSDALGGVINIITKRGVGDVSTRASVEVGSFRSTAEQASLSGGDTKLDYLLSVGRQDRNGFSAAQGGKERDGYAQTSVSGRLGLHPAGFIDVDVTGRFTRSRADIDDDGGAANDDPNRRFRQRQGFMRGQLAVRMVENLLRPVVGISLSDQSYDDNDDPDAVNPTEVLRSEFGGRLLKFDVQNAITVLPEAKFIVGAETERESGSSTYLSDGPFGPFASDFDRHTARTNAVFAESQLAVAETLFATAGLRVDHHERFGTEVTWKLAPRFRILEGTDLLGSIGTGFKAPSLYQLYSEFGRESLEPEEMVGVDAGIEQRLWRDQLTVRATYFYNDFDTLISFDSSTFLYENISRARTQGLELGIRAELGAGVSAQADYTYTESRDVVAKEGLLRRPRNKLSVRLAAPIADRGEVSVQLSLFGKRLDTDFSTFPAERVNLPGYMVAQVGGSYRLSDSVELCARVENLFDRQYEEVLGYATPGVSGFAGVRVTM